MKKNNGCKFFNAYDPVCAMADVLDPVFSMACVQSTWESHIIFDFKDEREFNTDFKSTVLDHDFEAQVQLT